MTTRNDIVAAARGWIGTPYHHQAALRGIGCDCLGLVRGVFAQISGREPECPPPYTPDWAEAARQETLIAAAGRHLEEIKLADAAPGDVLVFRLAPGAMAKHAGIMAPDGHMIHAYSGRAVVEVHIGPWWRRRLAAGFRFPGVTN